MRKFFSLLLILWVPKEAHAIRAIMEQTAAGNNTVFVDTINVHVGIGTTTASTLLDVAGSAQFGQGATKSTFTATGSLSLDSGATYSGSGAGLTNVPASALSGSPTFNVLTATNSFSSIGPETVGGSITVKGAGEIGGTLTARSSAVVVSTFTVQGADQSLGSYGQMHADSGGFSLKANNGNSSSSNMYIDTNGSHRIFVDQNGNVGIGINSGLSSTFTVAGIIQSTSGGFVFPDGSTQITSASGTVTAAGNNTFTGKNVFSSTITASGHLETSGTTPSVSGSNCGGSGGSVTGNDMAGVITWGGTNSPTCVLNFANAWANAPICMATSINAANQFPFAVNARSTTSVTFNYDEGGNFPAGSQMTYLCVGYH